MHYNRKTKKQLINEIEQIREKLESLAQQVNFPDDIEEKLLESDTIFSNAYEGIVITDSHNKILRVNDGFKHITGFSSEDSIGHKPSILKSGRHDSKFYENMYATVTNKGKWQGEIWNRRKNGEIYPQWLTIIAIKNSRKQIKRYIGLFTDVTRAVNKDINNIKNHAYYDILTGLPNRFLLHDRLSFVVHHAKRNNQYMALLLLDLNRFKLINDTLGFTAGDVLLQTVGNRLKAALREVDTVFRLGDDEFAIILEEISQPQDAAKVAKKIMAACSIPFEFSDHELYVTTSIGISIFPSDGDNLEILLKNAEAAMNRAKELGINNYQHYKPTMNSQAFEQLTLEHNLRKALKKNEFVVYYQPQVDLTTNRITGAEALLRWNHPDLGMISPAQFIPIAEQTGLILPLGEWVLNTACKQAHRWQQLYNRDLIMSVNLSARQFLQQDLVTTINRALRESSLKPQLLELEITESLGMKNPELTLKTLHELKEMGIHIAIDDFGTGYSSLSYLKKFPIDTLKIDRSFISELLTDPNNSAIVLAIIVLAHSLKLKVIAEGVEQQAEADFLQKHDCEQMQGYLFSPPVPAEEFEKMLIQIPESTEA